ncbi:phytoene synthase [Porphyrobacter sp. MBR-155]
MALSGFSVCLGVPQRDSLLATGERGRLGAQEMTDDRLDPIPPEADLALAWSPAKLRGPLTTAFQLDRRLARIVAHTTEPMLGQMRLAWWREALAKPPSERPRGDAVLDAIAEHWAGREAALIAMVDGWEVLVTAEQLGPLEVEAFGTQRAAFFNALHDDRSRVDHDSVAAAASRWAIADAAAGVSDGSERALLIEAGLARAGEGGRLPRELRGLAVLDALALRALRRGGRPLMEGRGASLAALRAAIFLR